MAFLDNNLLLVCPKLTMVHGVYLIRYKSLGLASVAQLDVRPTDDQEVVVSTPAGSATFFQGDLIMKYFLQSFSPFC